MRYEVGLLLLTLVVSSGCATHRAPLENQRTIDGLGVSEADGDGSPQVDRAVIRSGSLGLKAKDLAAVKQEVERIVAALDGRVDNWSLQDDDWLSMTVRVPEPQLDAAMDEIGTLGKVTSRSLQSRDVTEQMIDLEVRLRNLKALRDRLRDYLKQASNLKEILEVERELVRVQTQIESIEGKLKVLRSQVAMSALTVTARKGRFL